LTPDYAIWVSCFLAEAVLIVLLARSRAFRTFPAFFAIHLLEFPQRRHLFPPSVPIAVPPQPISSSMKSRWSSTAAMLFAVLVELAWSVLRPIRASLPKNAWIGIALFIALVGLLLWPVAGLTLPATKLAPAGTRFLPPAADIRHPARRRLPGNGRLKPIALYWLAQPRVAGGYWTGPSTPSSLWPSAYPAYPPVRRCTVSPGWIRPRRWLSVCVGLLGLLLCHQRSRAPRIHPPDGNISPGGSRQREGYPHFAGRFADQRPAGSR
jgi:hypothetical protein